MPPTPSPILATPYLLFSSVRGCPVSRPVHHHAIPRINDGHEISTRSFFVFYLFVRLFSLRNFRIIVIQGDKTTKRDLLFISIYFSFLEDNGEGEREISPTIQIIVLRMEHKNTRRRGKRSELGFSRRITSVESTLSPRLCFLWILHQLRSQGREVPRPFHAVSIFPSVFQDSIESSCWKYIIESSTSR